MPCCAKPKPCAEDLEDGTCCTEIEASEPGGTRHRGKEAILEVCSASHSTRRFRIPEFLNHIGIS